MTLKTKECNLSIVLTTENNLVNAKKLANSLLKMKLAGCISFNKISSIYWWEGSLEEEYEVQLIIKTRSDLVEDVFKVIKRIHTYDVPEFIAFPIDASEEYKLWLDKGVT